MVSFVLLIFFMEKKSTGVGNGDWANISIKKYANWQLASAYTVIDHFILTGWYRFYFLFFSFRFFNIFWWYMYILRPFLLTMALPTQWLFLKNIKNTWMPFLNLKYIQNLLFASMVHFLKCFMFPIIHCLQFKFEYFYVWNSRFNFLN